MAGPRPFFVGIAGGTGSGKTWLAEKLTNRLGSENTACLEQDAYYRDLSRLPPAQRGQTNFDHPRSLEADLMVSHLRALARGESIQKPMYDFARHVRTGDVIRVAPKPVIIVEGILILAMDTIADCLDLKIFIDVPGDIRFIRRLKRDRNHRGRTTSQVIAQYMDRVRPMHDRFVAPSRNLADLVLPLGYEMDTVILEIVERHERFVKRLT